MPTESDELKRETLTCHMITPFILLNWPLTGGTLFRRILDLRQRQFLLHHLPSKLRFHLHLLLFQLLPRCLSLLFSLRSPPLVCMPLPLPILLHLFILLTQLPSKPLIFLNLHLSC